MHSLKNLKAILALILSSIILISCGGKFPGADARKYDADPKKRVAKNLEEGRGFRISDPMEIMEEFLSLQALMNYGERL